MKKNTMIIVLIVFYAVGIMSAIFVLATGSKKVEQTKGNPITDSFSSITKINKDKDIIGLIKIDQPISFVTEGRNILVSQERGASYWLEQLNFAATNDKVKALIIQVNSPGGTVGASQELHAAVQRVKKAGKPVITSIADLSASGGYYATVSSDRIFANAGSLVGSIGVILGGIEFSDLLVKLGIKYQAITSGANKDILSPYKKMSPAQQQFLQTMVNNTYEQFLTAVAEGRNKSKDVIRPLADGSVFTGEQAVKNGLIDQVGTFYEAVAYTKETYNLTSVDVQLITPQSQGFNFQDLISIFAPQTPKINLTESTPALGYSPVLYLYQF